LNTHLNLQRNPTLVDMAGMRRQRAGASTRALVFDRRLVFLQRNRWRLFVLVAGYGLLFATIGAFLVPATGWWSGAYWGSVSVGLLWAISWFVSLDGSIFVRAGGWAEEWTSEALRKKASGFTLIDDFPLGTGNLDHVLVGIGGVVAVETKWKSKWRNRQHDLKDLEPERRQATFQAEKLQEIIESFGRSVCVRAAVVAWGPGIPTDECFVQFGRIGVFVGDRWKDWPNRALARDSIPESDAQVIAKNLIRFAEENSPRKMSLARKSFEVARALMSPTLHR
jgi:hypothetical protein